MTTGERKGARGRRRSPEVDRAILRAALAVMARRGYAGMSIEEVAEEAGVARPTVYLRYAGKEELATAALTAYRDHGRPEETGDTRADLAARLRHFRRGVERPFGMAMIGSMLAEERATPGLLALWRDRIVRPRRRELREVLEHARERGELRPGADTDAAVNMLVGSYYARYLAGGPMPEGWPEAEVDALLGGLLRDDAR